MAGMICPICNKSIKKGKLFIGWIHSRCLKAKKVDFVIKRVDSPNEMKQIEKICFNTYGELDFMEMGEWYDVRKMENLIAIKEKKVIGFAS